MKKLIRLLALVLLSSCDEHFKEKQLYGTYAPLNYKNTFDTIQLNSHGEYHRWIYDVNNKLALKVAGKWRLEKNTILHFDSYFLNLDRDVAKFPELLQDTLGGGGGLIETHNGTIQFCVGYYDGENCYQKIK